MNRAVTVRTDPSRSSRFWRVCAGAPISRQREMNSYALLPDAFLPNDPAPAGTSRHPSGLTPGQRWSQSVLRNRGDEAWAFAGGWAEDSRDEMESVEEEEVSEVTDPTESEPVLDEEVNPISEAVSGLCQVPDASDSEDTGPLSLSLADIADLEPNEERERRGGFALRGFVLMAVLATGVAFFGRDTAAMETVRDGVHRIVMVAQREWKSHGEMQGLKATAKEIATKVADTADDLTTWFREEILPALRR